MCTTRSWKYLEIINGSIIANRSDGLVIKFYELEFNNFEDFVIRLEEFRNCKCSHEAPCNKHLEEKERINARN